ncbi:MAG: cation transporter [Firmicutes bacterium]|nr:cation transporter [Bacillota bacterium]
MNILLKKYIPNYEDTKSSKVRNDIGKFSGYIGIVCNLILSSSKILIGLFFHSVSIQADGINNLSDATNNIVSIISFRISSKPADKEHPYGHERVESISTFLVTIFIAILGFSMLRESVLKIMKPEDLDFSILSIFVLLFSIVVKVWMYFFNKKLSITYNSSLLKAVAVDSLSDVIGTGAILISSIISQLVSFNLDGYMGVIVSILIFYNAYGLFKDSVDPLLGEGANDEDLNQISSIIKSHKGVYGVHDILVHTYGIERKYASAHVEVNGESNLFEIHELIDHIEREIKEEMGIDIVLHMDPIRINDPKTEVYKMKLRMAIDKINPIWSFHDFRYVQVEDKTLLYFDLIVPFDEKMDEKEIKNKITQNLMEQNLICFITIDYM